MRNLLFARNERIRCMNQLEEALRLPVAVLLDNVRSMYNVGAFFRAADGVGLAKL